MEKLQHPPKGQHLANQQFLAEAGKDIADGGPATLSFVQLESLSESSESDSESTSTIITPDPSLEQTTR